MEIWVSRQGTGEPTRLAWTRVGCCTNLPQAHGGLRLVGWIVQ